MKILYTIHQFFPKHYTGTERYLLNLAKMMQKLGHEVQVVTYMPTEEEGRVLTGDIYSRDYEYEGVPVHAIRSTADQRYVDLNFDHPEVESHLEKYITSQKPDLIHITHAMRMTGVFEISQQLRIPTVATLTDYWLICGKGILIRNNEQNCLTNHNGLDCTKYCYQHLNSSKFVTRMKRAKSYLSSVDATIFSARFLEGIFKKNGFVLSNPHLIRHGFNYFDSFHPITSNKKKKSTFTVSALGSLTDHKGADLLIQAFQQLSDESFRLDIYGQAYDPNFGESLRRMAKDDDRISFLGKYSVQDMSAIHDKTDIVAAPSTWFETYPLVGVAALAYGVPIIVPDMSGAAELIKVGENGYTFSIGDVDDLAKVINLASEEDLKHCQTIFYPFNTEQEAVETEQLYRSLV